MEDNKPYEKEIEIRLLGLLLNKPDLLFSVKEKLQADTFSNSYHKLIYRTIIELFNRNVEVDLVLLSLELQEKNKLDDAGGEEYLLHLYENPGKERNLDEYVDKIVNAFKVRSLLQIQNKIAPALSQYPVAQVLDELNSKINSISNFSLATDTVLLDTKVDSFLEDLNTRRSNPGLRGISTGFKELDGMTGGFIPGDIWYVGARPSMGKSSVLIKMLLDSALRGVPVLFFSKEMTLDLIYDRIFAMISKIPLQQIRLGLLSDKEYNLIKESAETLKTIPFLVDQNFMGGTDYVISTIRKFHHMHGIRLVAVDYIQLLVERSDNSTHELGLASRKLKLTSTDLGLTTIIASQMNRNVEMREDKRPMMSDLRQSGNLEEDADLMAALYRDDVYTFNSPDENKIEFIVRKQRNGPLGTLKFNFDKERAEPYD